MGRSHALLFGFLWCCHSAIGDSTSLHVPIFNSQTRHLFLVFSTQNCFLVELNTITMDFSYFNSNLSVGTKKNEAGLNYVVLSPFTSGAVFAQKTVHKTAYGLSHLYSSLVDIVCDVG